MGSREESDWVSLSPSFRETESIHQVFRHHAEELFDAGPEATVGAYQEVLDSSLARANTTEQPLALQAAIRVLTDLARQRWSIRVTDHGAVEAKRPTAESTNSRSEKARVRDQELLKRDEQLQEPAVRKFVRGMERNLPFKGRLVSVFSLFRDGRELAESLRKVRDLPPSQRSAGFRRTIDPYLQFIDDRAACEHTGLRLRDIWRYFRHTWTNQYTSTPGRWMAFLVRDRAREFHPVMGIGAIGSPIVQIRERDAWIGWDADAFFDSIPEAPPAHLKAWLDKIVDSTINELYIDDFLEESLLDRRDLTEPSRELIDDLKAYGEDQRERHRDFVRLQEHRAFSSDDESHWKTRAKTHLYRSKRALSLAEMLRTRLALRELLRDDPSAKSIGELIADPNGRRAVRTALRKAKADRVGIAMADITVCGAVEPYSQILVGKLVSMLAASPEVILAYRNRYEERESEIASSMAGRPVVRNPHLVLLGTTSLYGVGSSQYNRLRLPASLLGGCKREYLQFRRIGKSEAYGTSQFSSGTVEALEALVEQTSEGQRVNNIFGEGVSPKFRKLRKGLEVLGLPDNELLRHGRQRIVYGVALVRNLREFLLGLDEEPDYLIDLKNPKDGTRAIVDWWTERWLARRIMNDEILARMEKHALIRPIRHGARVVLPNLESEQGSLFNAACE